MTEPVIRSIPLDRLEPSPANVRKTPPGKRAFAELKASIAALDVLENLVVRDVGPAEDPGTGPGQAPGERFAVIAGARRLAALNELASEGVIKATRHNLELEQAVKDMTAAMAADIGHGLPEQAVKEKVETLLADGYPLSQEQSLAIRHATVKGGRVAVIEGAAGSGKTTTLRPITDLHKEHGYEIVPTAVAWRTAVALGDDCDARAFCVDKLLKLAAKGQVEIGAKTLIVVDEAGMLSTRQAHHILQLSERHGAKVVFAGDTQQQQPVEAGPGLRLIRDVAGSVRVDRIRRQKADLEDVLTHVHGETPEQARFRAGLTNQQEKDRILADYEAMEKKPLFMPWQVAVSEALRDGEAEKAIEAWHLRNRLHLCHDEEKTLTRLVDDWERHVRTHPDTSTVVLARTKAEGRALSWLMRQRVLAQTPDAKRAVIEVSRDLDGRLTEPLEIAVGDRIRIGATQWEKRLFNGTVVTVEDLEVRRGDDTAVSRKARNRQAAGHKGGKASGSESLRDESPVHITARTDDGRQVAFRHDEIRDWHDNIRLDYGYAMTIASAQGLTVDRAFLLVDDRPARETIYPAATRHREALDVYVNRSPLAFDIAEHRPEDQADMPVLDSDVRAYLAERWSRSQPKEAALDYVSDGAWHDAREDARHDRTSGERRQETTAEAHAAANDNALLRIAQEIRYAVNGWRHGAAVDAFAAERGEVLSTWDELRARAREEGEAVALTPAFRETLDRHDALMRQAAAFRSRPRTFEQLLAERAGIGHGELEELREVHARAGRYLRSASARTASAARYAAQPDEARTEIVAVDAPVYTPEPPVDEHAQVQPSEPVAPDRRHDTEPTWETLYDRLERDWNDLVAVANRAGLPLPLVRRYDELIGRLQDLAEHPRLPSTEHQELTGLLDYHHRTETAARSAVHDYLAAAERHVKACEPLRREAESQGVHVSTIAGWPEWRHEAQRLATAGRAILSDEDTYGAYLDAVAAGKPRAHLTVDQLRSRIEDGRLQAATSQQPKPRRDPAAKQEEGIAYILDDPQRLRELREQLKTSERKIGKQKSRSRSLKM